MNVEDVMTRDVLTIGPEASIRDIAKILVERGISGLPICDAERRVLGIVSEGDILYKEHDPAGGSTRRCFAWLVDGKVAASVVKSRARTAREAMSTPPITIRPDASIAEAARLMAERGVNRLPVVEAQKLVGIVTRADLVRAFARPDEEIAREIREELVFETLSIPSSMLQVGVERGNVTLSGRLPARSDAETLDALAGRVLGVVGVESALTWCLDDSGSGATRAVGAGEPPS
jgi:CBS domain-containing protein